MIHDPSIANSGGHLKIVFRVQFHGSFPAHPYDLYLVQNHNETVFPCEGVIPKNKQELN